MFAEGLVALAGIDDRTDIVRCVTNNIGTLSNCGDVYDFWFSWIVYRVLSRVNQTNIFQNCQSQLRFYCFC
jgi:hypothetical protein